MAASSSSSASLPIILQPSLTSHHLPSLTALHLLPFHIAYSGHSRIDAYFAPQPAPSHATGESSHEQAYFRGRRLMGTQLTLPQGYTGQIWESNAPAPTLSGAPVPRPVAKRDREPETPVYTHESPRRSPRKQVNTDTAHPTPSTTTASHRPPAKKIKLADKLAAAKAKKAAQAKPATGSAAAHHTIFDEVRENKPVKFSMDASPSPEPEDVLKLERDVREEQYEMHRTTADASQDMLMQNADAVKPGSALGDATVVQEAAQPVPKPPSAASLTLDLLDTPPRPSTPPTITSRLLPAPAFHIDADEPPLTFPQLSLQRDMMPIASWTTMTVWNPDTLPDLGDDPYVKSISEWTQLARLVHAV